MKLATTTSDVREYAKNPSDAVKILSQTKFRHLDLYLPHSVVKENWENTADMIGESAAKYGMTFVQSHAGDFFTGDCDMTESIEHTIQICHILGIKSTVVHAQRLPGKRYPDGRREFFEYNAELYRKLFPAMEKYGVEVLIENSAEINMGDSYYFMTGREMSDFIEYIGHPLLRAVWDTGHANIRANDQYRDITDLGDYLSAVHIHDNDGFTDEHTAPYNGTLDIAPIVRALVDINYKGCFTFEADNFPLPDRGWPHARRGGSDILRNVPLEIKLQYENILYDTGKYVLDKFGIFEAD